MQYRLLWFRRHARGTARARGDGSMKHRASSSADILDRHGDLVDVLVFVLWAALLLGMIAYW
jgi:hypothetical protein